MQLNDDDIREFIEVWRKDFGETLSYEEARHHASQILTLYVAVARSMMRAKNKDSRHSLSSQP